jgi:hypothetical protein
VLEDAELVLVFISMFTNWLLGLLDDAANSRCLLLLVAGVIVRRVLEVDICLTLATHAVGVTQLLIDVLTSMVQRLQYPVLC